MLRCSPYSFLGESTFKSPTWLHGKNPLPSFSPAFCICPLLDSLPPSLSCFSLQSPLHLGFVFLFLPFFSPFSFFSALCEHINIRTLAHLCLPVLASWVHRSRFGLDITIGSRLMGAYLRTFCVIFPWCVCMNTWPAASPRKIGNAPAMDLYTAHFRIPAVFSF